MEIERFAGYNYWDESTEDGASIQDEIEQYHAWDILNEPFPWHTSPKKTTKRSNEKMDMGTHSVSFEAEGLASGIYFYQFQSGKIIEAKNMIFTGVTK